MYRQSTTRVALLLQIAVVCLMSPGCTCTSTTRELPSADGARSGASSSSTSGRQFDPKEQTQARTGSDASDARAIAPREIHFVGRFDRSDSGGPRFAYPGTTISAHFSGTSIDLRLKDSGSNWFDVVVDGSPRPPLSTNRDQTDYSLVTGLADGQHDVSIHKRTEAKVGEVQFLGFVVGNGKLIATSPSTRRKIEFVGDSITAGYGNEGKGPNCTFTPETENESASYAALTARALNADCINVSVSGIGVYRNYDGSQTETMLEVYDRALPSDPRSLWDFSWIPDIVVVNLGDNDFTDDVPPHDVFVGRFAALLTKMRNAYPRATLCLTMGPMMSGFMKKRACRGYLKELVTTFSREGAKMFMVEFPTQDGSTGYGCEWHPSAGQHQKMSEILVAAIRSNMGWQ